jgi:hypothetical protein
MKNTMMLAAIVIILSMSSCRSPSSDERLRSEQTRFEEQQKRYPDRISSEQEAEDRERARKEDMLKKP